MLLSLIISLIDLDRRSVTYSAPYHKHRAMKLAYHQHQIGQIFQDAREYNISLQKLSREPILDMHVVHADPLVSEFLEEIFVLPQKRVARYAYLDHFQLRLANHAKALIEFVQEISLPSLSSGNDDKGSAVAAQWSLASTRRALGLSCDSSFGICLAQADFLCPKFADFIVKSSIFRNPYSN